MYSFGLLIFEMLTGRVPFTGDTSLSVAYQRIENDVPSPSGLISGVPPEFDELVAKATAREPAHRFADANEMAGALRQIGTALQLPSYRVPAPQESAEHLSASYRAVSPEQDGRQGPAGASVREPHLPQPVQHTRVVTAQRPRVDYGPPDGYDQPPVRQAHPAPPYSPYVDERNRSRRTVWVWVAIVATLTLLVGIGGWWLGFGRYSPVPPIAGLSTDKAVSTLQEAGFETEVRQKASDTIPVGGVVGSDPSAGSKVTKGSTVAVLVSSGKPKVPDVKPGDQVSKVNQLVRDGGLQPVDAGEESSTAPKGTVARVEPRPGTVLPLGAQVKVFRSKGSQPVRVPDVRGRPTAEAVKILTAAGITVRENRSEFDRGVEADHAISTEPGAGATIQSGDGVVLLVSNALKMPSLLGATVGDARTRLTSLGLQVQVSQLTRSDSSVIISQTPAIGANVEPGSTVSLVALPDLGAPDTDGAPKLSAASPLRGRPAPATAGCSAGDRRRSRNGRTGPDRKCPGRRRGIR